MIILDGLWAGSSCSRLQDSFVISAHKMENKEGDLYGQWTD